MRWGMVIDLKRCIGCFSCVITCKEDHFLPPGMFWNRILSREKGQYPHVRREVYPVLCNHCRKAPCVTVCPSGASKKREDGLVFVDPQKCVGCSYCVLACPYQQRTYWEGRRREYFPGQGFTPWEEMAALLYPLTPNTVVKCNFCKEKIDKGLASGLWPGIDREATPNCVNNCPVKARLFGDLDDRESEVSRLIEERGGFVLRPEFQTEPSVYYLPR